MSPEDRTLDKSEEEGRVDPQAIQKVKELILSLANTVSALKLFPTEHASARHFRQDFISRLKAFLDEYQKLELSISESGFYYQDKLIYQDEISSKSLPFFFYKDGLRLLYFYQGMDGEEINDFLELVRIESAKPPEESDVVNALWLKDLPNVQYYAPEEFIENRILEERTESLSRRGLKVIPQELAREAVDIEVNNEELFSGLLRLKPQEKQAINSFVDHELPENWQQDLTLESEEKRNNLTWLTTISQTDSQTGNLPVTLEFSEEEQEQLNRLLERNRNLSSEEEFINLMMEIMALEENEQQFAVNLDILQEFYLENIKNGHFNIPIILNKKIRELKNLLAAGQNSLASSLDDFLARTSDLKIFDEIRKLVENKVELNCEALYEYLNQFGQEAIPFLSELYEKIENHGFRTRVKNYFKEQISSTQPGIITAQIDGQKPQLTGMIIDIMLEQPAQKIIPLFAAFLTLDNKDLKLKAIESLSSYNDELANKLLLAFMNDEEQEVRLKATTSLKFLGDTTHLNKLISKVFSAGFKARSFEEKKAMFEFLGRTKNQEAFRFLKKIYLKKSWRRSLTELKICAIAGLETMGTKEAIGLLERGEHFLNRRVREASAEALVRLTLKNS